MLRYLSKPVTCCQGGQAVSVGGGNSIILPNNVIVSTAGAGVTGVNQGTVTVNPVTIGGAVTQAQGTSQKPVRESFLRFVDRLFQSYLLQQHNMVILAWYHNK